MRTNSVQLIGFVGNHLVEKQFPSGNKKVILRVATTGFRTGKKGETIYYTTWHNVVAWNKIGEFAAGNFVKGSRILVQGSIVYRTYSDHHCHTRYITEIKAASLQNLDR